MAASTGATLALDWVEMKDVLSVMILAYWMAGEKGFAMALLRVGTKEGGWVGAKDWLMVSNTADSMDISMVASMDYSAVGMLGRQVAV